MNKIAPQAPSRRLGGLNGPSVPQRLSLSASIRAALGAMLFSSAAMAERYFDPSALDLKTPGQGSIDLSVFNRRAQAPGVYRVDVYVNGKRDDMHDVNFVTEGGELRPQLSTEMLEALGVNTSAFPGFADHLPGEPLTALPDYIPHASTRLDINKLTLHISVPQAALHFSARNAIDPAMWDHGLPAFLLNYNATGSRSWQRQSDAESNNTYLNLNPGLNLGAWRLRNTSTYSGSDSRGTTTDAGGNANRYRNRQGQWRSVDTYAQRDVQRLRGQLTVGDSFTAGNVFDSVPFRGAQLATDDGMLPDSLRGYAPVIRGIANSNAQVTVRQNGYTIYQSYVAPGPFVLRDLYPTSSSGNLNVTITEADGSERTFVQPFSAVPIMQREGSLKYAVAFGQYRSQAPQARTPGFVQSSLVYGLNNSVTLYGGAQVSSHYHSGMLGLGHGLGNWGSVSLDATQANTTLQSGSQHQGQSFRVQYAKDVFDSGTTFTLAGYRYSTAGYYDFREANEIIPSERGELEADTEFWRQGYNKRSKMQLQISQSLGDFGSLYLTAFQQDYWKTGARERTFGAGYSVNHGGVSYSLNVDATAHPQGRSSRQMAFSVQIPLGKSSSHWASFGVQADNDGRFQQQAGFNGQLLEDHTLSYSVRQSYANQGTGAAGTAGLEHRGRYGRLQASYSDSATSQQVNYGIQGAVVVHPYGVTAGQSLGNSMALVRVPGAKNVKVQNQIGVSTDGRGYALLPYLNSYRNNRVALDVMSLGDDVDIHAPVQTLVPTSGAIVLADFQAKLGHRALVALTYQDKPVPFGAMATLSASDQGDDLGIVGEAGTVYLTGLAQSGQVTVKWGNNDQHQCTADYRLPELDKGAKRQVVSSLSAVCR